MTILIKKIGFTFLVVLIYLFGHNLILPIKNLHDILPTHTPSQWIKTINTLTGGNFSVLSIFSLGISPWMSTLILLQVISNFERLSIKNLSLKALYRIQILVTIAIAALQGTALLYLQFEPLTRSLASWQILALLLIIITGSIFVVWLGNLNNQYGVGGSMVIIIIGIVLNAVRTLSQLPFEKILVYKNIPYLLLGLVIVYFYIWQIIAMSQAEYQIPIRRILIQQDYKQKTYLPIPLLPSGGMQFMYAMMLFSLLASFIQGLHQHWSNIGWLTYISKHLAFNDSVGLIFYLFVVALLCFSFSNLNFNTEEISKELQKSGDYILNIMPGKQTKKYLDKILFKITLVEITYSCIMLGLPLIFTAFYPKYQNYAISVTMLFILVAMSLRIIQEIRFILQYDTAPSLIKYVQKSND